MLLRELQIGLQAVLVVKVFWSPDKPSYSGESPLSAGSFRPDFSVFLHGSGKWYQLSNLIQMHCASRFLAV